MKELSAFLIVTALIVTTCYSQENERKGFTSINLGLSIPTGNFRSTNFDNIEAGYAVPGSVFDISFGYNFRPNLGFLTLIRGQVNNFDAGAYAQVMADYLGTGYPAGSTVVGVKTSYYSMGGIMAGIVSSFPIAEKISFEPRLLIGFSTATLPTMITHVFSQGELLMTTNRNNAETVSFSYLIGAGAKVDLSNRASLLFNIDFYSAKAKWNDVQFISLGHITETFEVRYFDYEQNFSTVNISAGICFKF